MNKFKEEIKKAKEAILELEKRVDMSKPIIETYEEFEEIMKKIDKSEPTKTRWRNGTRKPDWESLKFFYENGVPLEEWFDIKWFIKRLKAESAKRRNLR